MLEGMNTSMNGTCWCSQVLKSRTSTSTGMRGAWDRLLDLVPILGLVLQSH